MKKCPHCGHEIHDDAYVCTECGRRVYLKKLYRSDKDKKFLGICGGLGEYFDIDSNLVRILVAFLILWTGVFPGLLAYIIIAFFIPYSPSKK